MMWRILLDLPSHPMQSKAKIILACMDVHSFIRESEMKDAYCDICDLDENYVPFLQLSTC
jgi:hypothetical protein